MELLLKDLSDGVLTLTLNRPEKRNALNKELMILLGDALDEAKTDPEVRVIVIRGNGKSFCSGADLGNLSDVRSNIMVMREQQSYYGNLLIKLTDCGKPTISCVHGHALAGGCGLAVTCDITFAAESTNFGIPEITRGIWGMMISAPITRLIGTKKSLELMYTGDWFSAEEAEKMGLINHAVPDDQLESTVYDYAKKLAARSPLATSLGREAVYKIRDMEFYKQISYLRDQVVILTLTDDAREGIQAFMEKREPVWSGR